MRVRGRRRRTFAERQFLMLLRASQELLMSYNSMAEQLDIERNTAIQMVKRLERTGRIVKFARSGTQHQNRYVLQEEINHVA